jgi:hypothetical protein
MIRSGAHTQPVDYGVDRGPRSPLTDDVMNLVGTGLFLGVLYGAGPAAKGIWRGLRAAGKAAPGATAGAAKSLWSKVSGPSANFYKKSARQWSNASLKTKGKIIMGVGGAGAAIAGAGTLISGRRKPGDNNDPFDRRDKARGISPSNLGATGDLTLGLHYGK